MLTNEWRDRTQFGLCLPTALPQADDYEPIGDWAQRAEELGFESVWVGDHLRFHGSFLEALVAASFAAATTKRVQVGFGVMLLALRDLAWTSAQLSTLQVLSQGRLILGVGVGGENQTEWTMAGVPFGERVQQTDTYMNALKCLFANEDVEVHGRQLTPPRPLGALPELWCGGRSDSALRRCVRHGAGYLGVWLNSDHLAKTVGRLTDLVANETERPPPMGLIVLTNPSPSRSEARDRSLEYLEGVYGGSSKSIAKWVQTGSPEDIASRVQTLIEAGNLARVNFQIADPKPGRHLEAVCEIVGHLSQ